MLSVIELVTLLMELVKDHRNAGSIPDGEDYDQLKIIKENNSNNNQLNVINKDSSIL